MSIKNQTIDQCVERGARYLSCLLCLKDAANKMARCRAFVVAGFVAIVLQVTGCMVSMPDDEVMIEQFQQNKDSFEQLLRLSQAQAHDTGEIHLYDDDPEAQGLMKRLGIRRIYGQKDHMVLVCTSAVQEGLSAVKGYVFIPPGHDAPPDSEVVRSLDAIDVGPYQERYKSIGDGWFLYVHGAD
jgi:hypothetical protein